MPSVAGMSGRLDVFVEKRYVCQHHADNNVDEHVGEHVGQRHDDIMLMSIMSTHMLAVIRIVSIVLMVSRLTTHWWRAVC